MPQGALEEFSRRRQEMRRAAEEGGFSLGSKRSAEAAAVDTRDRKQYEVETHMELGLKHTSRDRGLDLGIG